MKFLFRLWAQGLIKVLKLKFRQDYEAEVDADADADAWLRLRSLILDEILKLDFEVEMPMFG